MQHPPVISVVTHEAKIATRVRAILGDYHIIESLSGDDALARCMQMSPSVTIIDTQIPGIRWERLVTALRLSSLGPFHPILLMGTPTILEHAGFEPGIVDLVGRPPHPIELNKRVATFLRMQAFQEELEDVRNVLVSLAHAIEARDPYTHHHSERTSTYAVALAEAYGWPKEEYENIRIAGLLHDVGKIGIPDLLLGKVGKLSDEEFNAIKVHPVVGERICMSIAHFQHALPFIRNHHERIDGHGYPDGLQGEAIPGPARIIAIADSYDALTSTRPYRVGLSPLEATQVLTRHAGVQWDRNMVDIFVNMVHQDAFVGLPVTMRPPKTQHAYACK
jgi:putative two-component system response regulator